MRHQQQQQQQQQQLGMMRGRRDVSAATNRIRLHHGTRARARAAAAVPRGLTTKWHFSARRDIDSGKAAT